jgi:uncharacterized membrane protein
MEDMKIKIRISDLMNDVQIAAMSDKNVFDEGYIDDVNRRIGEIETALIALKHELTKYGLNDW